MKTTWGFIGVMTFVTMLACKVQADDFVWHPLNSQISGVAGLVAADFTGGGHPDIITMTESSVYGYANDGFNQFEESTIATGYFQLRHLDKGDLDGDGDLDLAIAAFASGGIYWLENVGNMRFAPHTLDDIHGYTDMEIGDLSGDEELDIVGSESGMWGAGLCCWENQGTAGFRKHVITSQHLSGFEATDFNGDGDVDVVGYYNGSVIWLENVGDLTFEQYLIGGMPAEVFLDLTTGDLNQDGFKEVVIGLESDLVWFVNHENQSFVYDTITTAIYQPINLKIQDIDNDGWPDLLTNSPFWHYFWWYENFAGSHFEENVIASVAGLSPFDLAQFNQDDKIDIALANFTSALGWGENVLNPTLKVAFEPLTSPPIIIPPQGGSFDYQMFLQNCTADTPSFDFWIIAEYEDTVSQQILVRLSQNRSLPPDTTIVQLYSQRVPPRPGVYWYKGYVGIYPNLVYDFTLPFPVILEIPPASVATSFAAVPSTSLRSSPNPFNPTTAISFELRAASYVSLRVYDTAGRLVTTLVEGWWEAGEHGVTFNGTGRPSGIYLARLEAGNFTTIQKLVLMK